MAPNGYTDRSALVRLLSTRAYERDWELLHRRLHTFTNDLLVAVGEPSVDLAPLSGREFRTVLVETVLLAFGGNPDEEDLEDSRFDVLANLVAIVGFPESAIELGYDAVRFVVDQADPATVERLRSGLLRAMRGTSSREDFLEELREDWGSLIESVQQFRLPSGVWVRHADVIDSVMDDAPEDNTLGGHLTQLSSRFIASLPKEPDMKAGTLLLPSLAVARTGFDRSPIHTAAEELLRLLYEERLSLRELHWRKLEEIVAELLSSKGFQVAVTDRSWDGGRDVIARGEFIPGEPTLLAVEVKHQPVTGIRDLRAALYANRNFPALLFASSGRFSAGVLKERGLESNTLRLYLKDEIGLTQWIDEYARHRGFGGSPAARAG